MSYAPASNHRYLTSSSSPSPERRRPPHRPGFAPHARVTSLAELKDRRSSMIASKPRESRRDRTFIGAACAACEEPLEHTLRGERILQLSCGHVAHEACFYEYIKEFDAQTCPSCDAPLGLDTRRGAGIDFENFNKLVRAAAAATPSSDHHDRHNSRDTQTTPTPWDSEPHAMSTSPERSRAAPRMNRDHLLPDHTRGNPSVSGSGSGGAVRDSYSRPVHARTRSGDTSEYTDGQHTPLRRHDYDVQSMETTLSNPARASTKNPIPAPTVTIRSEFPTLSRSRQQQSLTCLITVEVVDGSWQPSRDDLLRSPPLMPPTIPEESFVPELPKPAIAAAAAPAPPPPAIPARSTSRRGQNTGHETVHEDTEALAAVKDELYHRCENWHGLDFARFGRLILHGPVRVGKDRQTWQELECYLFTEMLICVRVKKNSANTAKQWDSDELALANKPRVSLKGSILIKKHLEQVETESGAEILTLSLSVPELPQFHLLFNQHAQLLTWRVALLNLNRGTGGGLSDVDAPLLDSERDTSGTEEDDDFTHNSKQDVRASSMHSSHGANRSQVTAPTEYTNSRVGTASESRSIPLLHVPLDIVVVVPVSSSMQGLKISLLRDALRFLVSSLGERDRMGLVTFGSGGMPLVGMTTKTWAGWSTVLDQIRPIGPKGPRADVVEGANVAVDLLMQRKASNPLSSILLISDAAAADAESVDFVVSRAEAAKIAIHSFGLGLTHKPDTLVALSTRTKASYVYVKDWMMLRECLGGCLGGLQSTSHQNVKLKLRLPEGSPAKFVKINGALAVTKRATGRDAEASLGDLRFGDKRDILVQLAISADSATPDAMPLDPWENIISGLEALGGPPDPEDSRTLSVEELPLIQADLAWGDILREGSLTQLARPSLLAITVLPAAAKRATLAAGRPPTPPIPPHPQIVQRRMELLTSDMLTRSLTLVSRGQHDRASHLLAETRSILKGLGKGGLPPLPPPPPPSAALPATPATAISPPSVLPPFHQSSSLSALPTPHTSKTDANSHNNHFPNLGRTPSPPRAADAPPLSPPATHHIHAAHQPPRFPPHPATSGIDAAMMAALDAELTAAVEWIAHPAVFARDTRKAVLQAIGVISSQRAVSFRSPVEALAAGRIPGVRRLAALSREWRDAQQNGWGDDSLAEESS